ncbi:MAG: hypothetical protein WCR72_09635 [Bacteroidota bacterium]
MKRIYSLVLITGFLLLSLGAISQPPPPPSNPSDPAPPVGGSAAIENGSFILFTLAAAYAIRKVYVIHAKKTAEE